jgi:hypothetical protein
MPPTVKDNFPFQAYCLIDSDLQKKGILKIPFYLFGFEKDEELLELDLIELSKF